MKTLGSIYFNLIWGSLSKHSILSTPDNDIKWVILQRFKHWEDGIDAFIVPCNNIEQTAIVRAAIKYLEKKKRSSYFFRMTPILQCRFP